jgi:hypothetical protein
MSAVERFFERLFERPSARLFGARVRPVQLQRRLERAMEQGRVVEAGRTRVPDRMTIRLAPLDLESLETVADLPVSLASGALEWARRRAYLLAARPRVAIEADDLLLPGDVDIEARFTERDAGPENDERADPALTRVFDVPVLRAPRATLSVHEPGAGHRAIIFDGRPLSIGRAPDNSLVLADARVSRSHARLQVRDGVLVLTDLGSTNGTRLNGASIREVVVGVGDMVGLGNSTITIVALGDEVPVQSNAEAERKPA